MKFEITCPIKAWELVRFFDQWGIESGYPNWNPIEGIITVQVDKNIDAAQLLYKQFIES